MLLAWKERRASQLAPPNNVETTMRVEIDVERCQGHGRCASIAPEVFELDEQGHALLPGGGEVSGPAVHAALRAERNCPERAISIRESRMIETSAR